MAVDARRHRLCRAGHWKAQEAPTRPRETPKARRKLDEARAGTDARRSRIHENSKGTRIRIEPSGRREILSPRRLRHWGSARTENPTSRNRFSRRHRFSSNRAKGRSLYKGRKMTAVAELKVTTHVGRDLLQSAAL